MMILFIPYISILSKILTILLLMRMNLCIALYFLAS